MSGAAQLLRDGAARLRAAQVPDAMGDARALLAHAAQIPPDRLTLHLGEAITPEVSARFETFIAQRALRVPVSHIVGKRLFWGRRFYVNADVLDPRPETETLLAAALAGSYTRVLDLGTGSGCILLSLLAERPAATGVGVDLSSAALDVARQNAAQMGLEARAQFMCGDWFSPVCGRFDLITANPPYIAAKDMDGLAPELLHHEPRMALTDEADGLSAYRHIAQTAGAFLAPHGTLMVEIGHTQGAAVLNMMRGAGLTAPRVLPDLDGRDRVIIAQAA